MAVESSYILLVKASGAGPPFSQLNLMPKSFSGPPGLWDAVKTIPPVKTRNVLDYEVHRKYILPKHIIYE